MPISKPPGGGAGNPPPSGGNGIITSGEALLAVVAAGAIMIILADPFPTLINGLLILILVGALIQSESSWTSWLQAASASFKA